MHSIRKESQIDVKIERWMTIDPGLNGHTGWAIFTKNNPLPIKTGIIRNYHTERWEFNAHRTAMEIKAWSLYCDLAYIEMPEFWSGSATSFASTAKGDLFKLSFLVGAIYQALTSVCPVTLITPREWKGQLKKEMVHRRIHNAIHIVYPEHIADAVGMGLALIGRL